MTVQDFLETIDISGNTPCIEVVVRSHNYDTFTTTHWRVPEKFKDISQTTFSLYRKIKDYYVKSVSFIKFDEDAQKCWLYVDAYEKDNRKDEDNT